MADREWMGLDFHSRRFFTWPALVTTSPGTHPLRVGVFTYAPARAGRPTLARLPAPIASGDPAGKKAGKDRNGDNHDDDFQDGHGKACTR